MAPVSLSGLWRDFMARQLGRETAAEPETQHAQIADQGPQRMAEAGRAVALDQQMPEPGRPVTGERGQDGEPPVPGQDREGQESEPGERAGVMQRAGPGPAVLGDARALTGILLQRQLFRPGDPERTGWIVFAGESLNAGGAIDIDLDLGSGLQRFRFAVPTP